MENIYTKRKDNSKKKNITIDPKLYDIADKLLEYNPDCVFAISKSFMLNGNGSLGKEIRRMPCIITSIEVNKLVIPSCFKLLEGNYLSTWCDDDPLIKLESRNIIFEDGDIKGKKIKNLYLKIK